MIVRFLVFVGVHVTEQVEVLDVAATRLHVLAERVGFDDVKFAVPRGESFGCPAEVFVTVAVQVVP